MMVKRRQPGETSAQNIYGSRRAQDAVILPWRNQQIVQAIPVFTRDPLAGLPVELEAEELSQIQPVNPLHHHDPGVSQGDKITNVHQVVMLDLADLLTLVRNALHLDDMRGLRNRLVTGIQLEGYPG